MNARRLDSLRSARPNGARRQGPCFTWTLFLVQLCSLAVLVGMSLVLAAAEILIYRASVAASASALALGALGAALAATAWRNMTHRLDRAARG